MRDSRRHSRAATIFSLVFSIFIALPVAMAGGPASPYVDPDVYTVLDEEGAVNIILSMKHAPVELPEQRGKANQQELAIAQGKQARKDFARKFEALLDFTRTLKDFEIQTKLEVTLTIYARVSSKDTLDALSRFPHLKAIHWADKPVGGVTPSYATEPEKPFIQNPAHPRKGADPFNSSLTTYSSH